MMMMMIMHSTHCHSRCTPLLLLLRQRLLHGHTLCKCCLLLLLVPMLRRANSCGDPTRALLLLPWLLLNSSTISCQPRPQGRWGTTTTTTTTSSSSSSSSRHATPLFIPCCPGEMHAP
jgi:hypothetical protein